jgi:hypothetical protein
VRAIILDHAGSVHAHGLPQDDRVFSLDPRQHIAQEWDRMCAQALERGYQPGWVYHRWKEKFGKEPPRAFRVPRPAPAGGGVRVQDAALRDALKDAARGKRFLSWAEIDRLRGG